MYGWTIEYSFSVVQKCMQTLERHQEELIILSLLPIIQNHETLRLMLQNLTTGGVSLLLTSNNDLTMFQED